MPKATLSFTLPEEQEEFNTAKNGANYAAAIAEMDNWLRSQIKYNDALSEEARATLEDAREQFRLIREDEDAYDAV